MYDNVWPKIPSTLVVRYQNSSSAFLSTRTIRTAPHRLVIVHAYYYANKRADERVV